MLRIIRDIKINRKGFAMLWVCLAVVLVGTISILAYSYIRPRPTRTADVSMEGIVWKKYTDQKFGFSLEYPEGWQINVTDGSNHSQREVSFYNQFGVGIRGGLSVNTHDGTSLPTKSSIETAQKKFNEKCNDNNPCGGGSPLRFLGEAEIDTHLATKARYSAGGALSGNYIVYYIPFKENIYSITLEADRDGSSIYDIGNSPAAVIFQRMISSFKFSK